VIVTFASAGLLAKYGERRPIDPSVSGESSVHVPPPAPRRAWAERFPNVPLQTHEGKTVRFYDDLIKGKIVGINFMYATCTGT
jgi:hypothetical protein